MNPILETIHHRLIVSAQAYPGEPMRDPRTMTQIAQACVQGGAAAIRAQGLADLACMKEALDVPIIGLWKDGHDGVFITPTLNHALAVAGTGVSVVAIDGTRRERPDHRSFEQTCTEFKKVHPDVLIMADCGCLDDAKMAQECGADIVGTTLAGYTPDRVPTDGPDLELVEQITQIATVPLIVEGRIHTVEDAAAAMAAGAFAVVVGTAITHPCTITSWFAQAVARS